MLYGTTIDREYPRTHNHSSYLSLLFVFLFYYMVSLQCVLHILLLISRIVYSPIHFHCTFYAYYNIDFSSSFVFVSTIGFMFLYASAHILCYSLTSVHSLLFLFLAHFSNRSPMQMRAKQQRREKKKKTSSIYSYFANNIVLTLCGRNACT